jgi:hypothetical protein
MMGLFDYIEFQQPLPEFPVDIIPSGNDCPQTKSFYFPCMDHYIIAGGKLYRNHKEYKGTGEYSERFLGKHSLGTYEVQELVSDVDIPVFYHGDIYIHCSKPDGGWARLVVRFTDGDLQWIKKEEDVVYET